ncbi:A disintegrin and metalloproteinase with thrombospondin motifs 19 [Branchiostoma belcheri]|nr:A disintegrin and metalloproteinase with thrombospondin motifs 19 [Branchiostoma belcheri]
MGLIKVNNEQMLIEPLSQRRRYFGGRPHRVYRRELPQASVTQFCGTETDDRGSESDEPGSRQTKRSAVNNIDARQRTVEALVVLDKSIVKHHGRALVKTYALTVMSMVGITPEDQVEQGSTLKGHDDAVILSTLLHGSTAAWNTEIQPVPLPRQAYKSVTVLSSRPQTQLTVHAFNGFSMAVCQRLTVCDDGNSAEVNSVISLPSMGHNINIAVTKLVILEEDQVGLKLAHHADSALHNFCQWQREKLPYVSAVDTDTNEVIGHRDRPSRHDAAILLTRIKTLKTSVVVCTDLPDPRGQRLGPAPYIARIITARNAAQEVT